MHHEGVAQLFGVTGRLRPGDGRSRVPGGVVEPAGPVRRVRQESLGPRVLGTPGAPDVLTDVVPESRLHGGPRQLERELDVLATRGIVEHRTRHCQGLACPPAQAEQPDALDRGRRGAQSGPFQVVDEPLGGVEGPSGHVATGQGEQQVGNGVVGTRPEQQVGGGGVVLAPSTGQQRLGRPAGEQRQLRRQHQGEDGLAGQRVAPAQGAGVDQQQPSLLRRPQRRQHLGLGDPRDAVEQ